MRLGRVLGCGNAFWGRDSAVPWGEGGTPPPSSDSLPLTPGSSCMSMSPASSWWQDVAGQGVVRQAYVPPARSGNTQGAGAADWLAAWRKARCLRRTPRGRAAQRAASSGRPVRLRTVGAADALVIHCLALPQGDARGVGWYICHACWGPLPCSEPVRHRAALKGEKKRKRVRNANTNER